MLKNPAKPVTYSSVCADFGVLTWGQTMRRESAIIPGAGNNWSFIVPEVCNL